MCVKHELKESYSTYSNKSYTDVGSQACAIYKAAKKILKLIVYQLKQKIPRKFFKKLVQIMCVKLELKVNYSTYSNISYTDVGSQACAIQ